MEECEDALRCEAAKHGGSMPAEVVATLAASMVLPTSNVEENRKLWDLYADNWSPETPWVVNMAAGTYAAHAGQGTGSSSSSRARPAAAEGDEARSHGAEGGAEGPVEPKLDVVGDEWSPSEHLDKVVQDFIVPYVNTAGTRAAEIGSGGGRVALRVAPLVKELVCFDISSRMLARCRQALASHSHVSFALLQGGGAPVFKASAQGAFDFVYAFDVFVHVDLHTLRDYLVQVAGLLRPGGRCFFSAANMLSPGGWQRFSSQRRASVAGFCFASPEIVRRLIANAGLRILKEAPEDAGNCYYNRDYLVLVERPADSGTEPPATSEAAAAA